MPRSCFDSSPRTHHLRASASSIAATSCALRGSPGHARSAVTVSVDEWTSDPAGNYLVPRRDTRSTKDKCGQVGPAGRRSAHKLREQASSPEMEIRGQSRAKQAFARTWMAQQLCCGLSEVMGKPRVLPAKPLARARVCSAIPEIATASLIRAPSSFRATSAATCDGITII